MYQMMSDDSLNPELHWLKDLGRIMAETGLALETTPDAWTRLWEVPALRAIAYIDVPPRFNPHPLSDFGIDACPYSLQLVLIEYLSRFDASCLMALPGSSLSTRAILTLGTNAQIDHFFERFSSSPHWAFLAVTEPDVGSDVSEVKSRVSCCGMVQYLNAVKTLIGGAQQASIGLLFARMESCQRPCLVMIEPPLYPHNIYIENLATLGFVGAGLCRIEVRDLPIGANQIVGAENVRLRHGLRAIAEIFERHRPMVGAMALGAAYGLIDALEHEGAASEALAAFKLEHEGLYRRMKLLGSRYEESRLRAHEASLFKLHATRFVERVARSVPQHLSPNVLLSSLLLRKRYRDAFAFEYMEGTSHIHILNTFRAYVASRLES